VNEVIETRPIAGFEGRYSATSSGRIISHVGTNRPNGHMLGAGTPGRYCLVMLRKDGRTWPFGVHRLICEAFHGPKPSPTHSVNHINGQKHDNRAENLEWATPAENAQHAIRTGLNFRKLTPRDRILIKRLYASGISQGKIAQAFGVTSCYVSQVCSDYTVRRGLRISAMREAGVAA
jgi:hypothetical protein